MSRIFIFLMGVVVGAFAHNGALNYHVVRADDGYHLIPKISSGMVETYVDIREFGLTDWNQHKTLAAAIVRADKSGLLEDAATGSLQRSLDSVVDVLNGS